MLICKSCIDKKLPPYTYNKENFEIQFGTECHSGTEDLDYKIFKNRLFQVMPTDYKVLRDLPDRAGWLYEAHDEEGVCNFYDLIEWLVLNEDVTEVLAE